MAKPSVAKRKTLATKKKGDRHATAAVPSAIALPAGATEIIRLPSEPDNPDMNFVAASKFIAALAYPNKREIKKRNDFILALIAIRLKQFSKSQKLNLKDAPPLFKKDNRDLVTKVTQVKRRILNKRIPAAILYFDIFIAGTPAKKAKANLLEKMKENGWINPGDYDDLLLGTKNITTRIYRESAPIAHMALAFMHEFYLAPNKLQKQFDLDARIIEMFADFNWVHNAINSANRWRPELLGRSRFLKIVPPPGFCGVEIVEDPRPGFYDKNFRFF